MSAVNRERRKNAGKRMAILGKNLSEEDDAFWSHETWADDEDSGNESFHESDEDSALRKDVFDSDFNDSESDNEADEVAAGEAEERELRKRERAQRSNNAYKHSVAGFANGHKRKRGFAGGAKRILGEGFNAGIVLNLPPESFDSLSYSLSMSAKNGAFPQQFSQTQQVPIVQSAATAPAATIDGRSTSASNDNKLLEQKIPPQMPLQTPTTTTSTAKSKTKTTFASPRKSSRLPRVSVRESRSTHGPRKLRGSRGNLSTPRTANTSAPARKASTSKASTSKASDIAKRKRFAQEELLLEAIHDTEPENQRWLHGRKRVQDQYNRDKDSSAGAFRDKNRGKKIIQKFHSRRGCLTTLTFPEMDSVPEILTRRRESTNQQHQLVSGQREENIHSSPLTSPPSKEIPQQQPSRCVITGKDGKYKDPLTKYPYHDLAAFKELRRRQRDKVPIATKRTVKTSRNGHGGGGEGSKVSEASFASTGSNNAGKTKPLKGDKKRPASLSHSSNGNNPKNLRKTKKPSLSVISAKHKLPFQSPKPPPRPSPSVSSSQPKPPPSGLEHLAFSWGNQSDSAPDGMPSNGLDSPISPSGRRLSPRKWKPSEKVLETIAMLPEKESGGAAAVPCGLGIQPLSRPSSSNHQSLDNGKNKSTIGYIPASANQSSPASIMSLAPKPLPPDKSLISSTESNNHAVDSVVDKGRHATKPIAINGSSVVASNQSNSNTSIAIPKSAGVAANRQQSGNVNAHTTGSSFTPAVENSKGNKGTESRSTQVLATNASIPDKGSLAGTKQLYSSAPGVNVPTGSALNGTAGDKQMNANIMGQVGGSQDKTEPVKKLS
jgi:hypothetical protein